MNEEEYDELVDDTEDQMDDSQEMTEEQLDSYDSGAGYSVPKEKSDLYNWFWRVVRLGQPERLAKVGNLSKTEIGDHGISMRDAMNLANLGNIFHHKKFANYWQQRAMITSATSMSKDGWFMDLSISQKKVRARQKSSTPFQKSRIFGRKRQDNQEQGSQQQ